MYYSSRSGIGCQTVCSKLRWEQERNLALIGRATAATPLGTRGMVRFELHKACSASAAVEETVVLRTWAGSHAGAVGAAQEDLEVETEAVWLECRGMAWRDVCREDTPEIHDYPGGMDLIQGGERGCVVASEFLA